MTLLYSTTPKWDSRVEELPESIASLLTLELKEESETSLLVELSRVS